MAMTVDCDKLLSMSGYVTPPPPAVNLQPTLLGVAHEEEVATPKLGAGAGQMDGFLAEALHVKLQQLENHHFWKSAEAHVTPGLVYGDKINFGDDFVKVPLPGQEVDMSGLPPLPPPQPHAVQRPQKDPRFRPIPDRSSVLISKGSVGHPVSCAAACKYVKRKGGCRDGANCPNCHECFWSKASSKDGEKRMDNAHDLDQALGELPEPLVDKFVRLLSGSGSQDLTPVALPPQEGVYPAAESVIVFSQGTFGHPFACAKPCKQARRKGGCLLGESCQQCHACSLPRTPEGPAPVLNLQTLVQPAAEPQNPGSLGHPFSCGPACKYVLKARGCKDGDLCTHCHICRWTRYAAKTLKL